MRWGIQSLKIAAIKLLMRALALAVLPLQVLGLEAVTFATDWKAQAEQGGFYQAKALGLYEKAGLDVTIRGGGPGVNIPQLLGAAAIDFGMGSNSFIPLNMVRAGVPAKAVMAAFQKDPQVLITHPRADITTLADIKGKPVMIADASINAFWVWLRAKYDFSDRQIRKYTFNLAPFLVNPKAVQQGYVTSEPYTISTRGGFEPQVFLLSDFGYPSYAAMVLAQNRLIEDSRNWCKPLSMHRLKAGAAIFTATRAPAISSFSPPIPICAKTLSIKRLNKFASAACWPRLIQKNTASAR